MCYIDLPEPPLETPECKLRKVYTCELCEEPIYEGDDYYDIPGLGHCHTGCVEDCKHYCAE